MMLYIPIFSFNIIYFTSRNKESGQKTRILRLLSRKEFSNRFKILISDISLKTPLRYHQISLFYFRRNIFSLIIIIFYFSPFLTLIFIGLLTGMSFVYFVLGKPYISFSSRINSALNELYLVLIITILSVLPWANISSNTLMLLGYAVIGVIMMCITTNWIILISCFA